MKQKLQKQSIIRKLTKIFMVILGSLFILGGCERAPRYAEVEITPLLWRATAPNSQEMYLFGSIHAADSSIYPLPEFVMDAFDRSDYLAVEINLLNLGRGNEPWRRELYARLTYQDGKTIVSDMGEQLHNRWTNIFEEHAFFRQFRNGALDGYMPGIWYTRLIGIINGRVALEAGLSFEYGLDMYFLRRANRRRDMEILELESVELQARVLKEGLSTEFYIYWLEEMAAQFEEGDMEHMVYEAIEIYTVWKSGDEEALAYIFLEELTDEWQYAILTSRDIDMTQRARELMAEEKKVFVVVGAGHLIGEGSIIDLLIQEGYDVVRVLY